MTLSCRTIIMMIATACLFLFAYVPFARAAATGTTAAASSTVAASTATPSVGAAALKKAIAAEKVRLAQIATQLKPTPGIAHSLRRGSSGEEVRLLQKFLGLYATSSAPRVTGYFGTQTRRAVKEFQRKESIESVGIVGPKTRARILALSSREIFQAKADAASTTSATTTNIENVILSADVGEDGSGIGSTTLFASTTKNIYAIVTLANARQDTEIGLIRYFKETYVDSEVSHPSRSGLRYMHFQWSLKDGANRTPGSYAITFYVNGKRSKSIAFTIN